MDSSQASAVYVEALPGHVALYVKGSDPAMPIRLVMTPMVAYNLANNLSQVAQQVQKGGGFGHPVQVAHNVKPPPAMTRQPLMEQGRPVTGPQSSVDGVPRVPKQNPPAAPPALLGDEP